MKGKLIMVLVLFLAVLAVPVVGVACSVCDGMPVVAGMIKGAEWLETSVEVFGPGDQRGAPEGAAVLVGYFEISGGTVVANENHMIAKGSGTISVRPGGGATFALG